MRTGGQASRTVAPRAACQHHERVLAGPRIDTLLPEGLATFARNLTPDASGLGNFTNQEIFNAMRNGADKREGGVLKPPMPWPALHNLSDADTWAIVAYLRSVKPVANTVPTDVVPPGFPGFNTTALPLPNYPGSNEVP